MAFNRRLLTVELSKQVKPIYAKVKPFMQEAFNDRKEQVLAEFDEHPVTRALQAGAADSTADDGLVNTAHGGNLYSLIGFNEGEDPTVPLRDMLEKDLRLNISQTTREVKNETIIFRTPVKSPTLATVHKQMAKDAKVEWSSRGFTDLIERGVTGFGRYLFNSARRFPTSRSGPALQIKKATLRSGSAPRFRYISDILSRFRDLITGRR